MIVDRRRYVRIAANGTVVLRVSGTVQRGRLADLSEGGLYVRLDETPEQLLAGCGVEVEMRLDGAPDRWLTASGRVVRVAADGLAILFASRPAMLTALLDQLTVSPHAKGHVFSVVLFDADPERRSTMVSAFRAVGCAVIETASPLEAIVRLGESSFEPDVIAIADSQPTSSAESLRAFARINHPQARLVSIIEDSVPPDGIMGRLSAADPNGDLPQRIRDLLSRVLSQRDEVA